VVASAEESYQGMDMGDLLEQLLAVGAAVEDKDKEVALAEVDIEEWEPEEASVLVVLELVPELELGLVPELVLEPELAVDLELAVD
jgi:hypothetical protein